MPCATCRGGTDAIAVPGILRYYGFMVEEDLQ